jgi:nitrile hydratase
MNGVHDMGGMHGFGPIEREEDEPVFHEAWEGRVLALTRACGAWGKWNIDKSRFAIEQMPPEDYLRASYYEKWLWRLEKLLVDAGMMTREELDERHAALKRSEGGH